MLTVVAFITGGDESAYRDECSVNNQTLKTTKINELVRDTDPTLRCINGLDIQVPLFYVAVLVVTQFKTLKSYLHWLLSSDLVV